MPIVTALITVADDKGTSLYVYKGIGGQPQAFVNMIATALGGHRRKLSVGRLVSLMSAAAGLKRAGNSTIYYEIERAFNNSHEYRYEIELLPLKPIALRVTHISDAGNETLEFGGPLEHYVSMQLRKLKKPRGRTPAGYRNREEWEEAYAQRSNKYDAPISSSTEEDILRERAQTDNPKLDLRGVKVYSKEELLSRSRDIRKARKARKNKKVSSRASDD